MTLSLLAWLDTFDDKKTLFGLILIFVNFGGQSLDDTKY